MNANLKRGIFLAALLAVTSLTQAADPASPRPATPVARPAIVGVAHIGLKTDNLEAARKFYTGILGFQEPFSLDKTPDDDMAIKMQERIVAMATLSFARPTAPPKPVTRTQWFWMILVIGVIAGVIASFAIKG